MPLSIFTKELTFHSNEYELWISNKHKFNVWLVKASLVITLFIPVACTGGAYHASDHLHLRINQTNSCCVVPFECIFVSTCGDHSKLNGALLSAF